MALGLRTCAALSKPSSAPAPAPHPLPPSTPAPPQAREDRHQIRGVPLTISPRVPFSTLPSSSSAAISASSVRCRVHGRPYPSPFFPLSSTTGTFLPTIEAATGTAPAIATTALSPPTPSPSPHDTATPPSADPPAAAPPPPTTAVDALPSGFPGRFLLVPVAASRLDLLVVKPVPGAGLEGLRVRAEAELVGVVGEPGRRVVELEAVRLVAVVLHGSLHHLDEVGCIYKKVQVVFG